MNDEDCEKTLDLVKKVMETAIEGAAAFTGEKAGPASSAMTLTALRMAYAVSFAAILKRAPTRGEGASFIQDEMERLFEVINSGAEEDVLQVAEVECEEEVVSRPRSVH